MTISFYSTAQSPPVSPNAAARSRLSEKFDSLDLIKQDLKRQGRTIADIEHKQEILRDSLKFLRTRLESIPKTAPRSTSDFVLSKFLNKPVNLIDWIIVITGIIALFSGVMLFIGVTRAFSGKRRPKRRTQDTIRPTVIANADKLLSKPASAYPENIPEPATPPLPKPANADIGSVTQLRRRIEKYQITPGMYDTPHIPELPPAPEPPPPDESSNELPIEDRVIAASRSGLDIPALSKKFQLSSDHVALILKMAGKRR